MVITKATLPNGKELIFCGGFAWQRWDSADCFQPFDLRILDHTPLPEDSVVEGLKLKD